MQIVYTCPKCGADLQEVMLATNPPMLQKQCMSCGWSYTDTDREDVIRIPFEPPTEHKAIDYQSIEAHRTYQPAEACRTCSKNPLNGGDGICHCTLGNTIITF